MSRTQHSAEDRLPLDSLLSGKRSQKYSTNYKYPTKEIISQRCINICNIKCHSVYFNSKQKMERKGKSTAIWRLKEHLQVICQFENTNTIPQVILKIMEKYSNQKYHRNRLSFLCLVIRIINAWWLLLLSKPLFAFVSAKVYDHVGSDFPANVSIVPNNKRYWQISINFFVFFLWISTPCSLKHKSQCHWW